MGHARAYLTFDILRLGCAMLSHCWHGWFWHFDLRCFWLDRPVVSSREARRRIMMNYLNFDVKYQMPSCTCCLCCVWIGVLGLLHIFPVLECGHASIIDDFQTAALENFIHGRINITDIDNKIILRARQNKLFSLFSEALPLYMQCKCLVSSPKVATYPATSGFQGFLKHQLLQFFDLHNGPLRHLQEAASLSLPDLSKHVNEASFKLCCILYTVSLIDITYGIAGDLIWLHVTSILAASVRHWQRKRQSWRQKRQKSQRMEIQELNRPWGPWGIRYAQVNAGYMEGPVMICMSWLLTFELLSQEYETLVDEHNLKLKQHSELTENVQEWIIGRAGGGRDQGLQWLQPLAQEAIKSGSKERILSAAREVLMESWYRMALLNFPQQRVHTEGFSQ